MRINLAHGAHASSRLPAYQQLPLWRDSNRLLVAVENAVRGFPRYHKYALGADLLRYAMCIGLDLIALRSKVARGHTSLQPVPPKTASLPCWFARL